MDQLTPSLTTPLERLPGVGTTRAQRLELLKLVTVRDALVMIDAGGIPSWSRWWIEAIPPGNALLHRD
ncbi:MAG: hypothetical protein ACKOEM_18590 [Planctomycetia bacterium]